MGSGCTCQSATVASTTDRVRVQRMGNFTFLIHDGLVENQGCKRTPAWETSFTKEQVEEKRKEFWETRVDGNPEAWIALKAAADEPDIKEAEAIVTAAGLTCINGLLMTTLDDTEHRYCLPPYVLNEPIRYGKGEADPKLPENYEVKNIRVCLRSGKFPEFEFEGETNMNVGELKEKYEERNEVEERVRLIFGGREMKDSFTLGHYGIEDGVVIQVFFSL